MNKYKCRLKNIGDVEMHISPISSYRSNPQNQQSFSGLNLRKGLLYAIMGLSSLGLTANKVAAQTAQAAKPIYHAVDSVALSGNRGLKLYVAGDNSNTFKRIFGYLFDPSAELIGGKTKRTVDVLVYEPEKNRVIIALRDDKDNPFSWIPSDKIEAYLKGKGKNQAGDTVSMASDSNIKIVQTLAPAP